VLSMKCWCWVWNAEQLASLLGSQ